MGTITGVFPLRLIRLCRQLLKSVVAGLAMHVMAGCQPTPNAKTINAEPSHTHGDLIDVDGESLQTTPELPVLKGWPCLYGPSHLNVSLETNLALPWPGSQPAVLWENDIGTGYSAPVVVDGRLIVLHRIGDEEIVECFDPNCGTSLWQHRYPTSYVCRYEYSNGPYSTPVIHNGRVYAVGGQAQMHCLNLSNGSLVWERRLAEEYLVQERPVRRRGESARAVYFFTW